MDSIDALRTRVSVPALTGPEPGKQELQAIFESALRAADHAMLKPWRFLLVRGEARTKLGNLFVRTAETIDPSVSSEKLARVKAKTLRAPLIVIAIASLQEHPKVPEVEQLLSTGAAIQNMLNAAHALGIGGIWRTGTMAYHHIVKEGLALAENERIVGFLYLGQKSGRVKSVPELNTEDYFTEWT